MQKWHDMLYDAVAEICHDREYVYASFLRVFRQLSEQIYGCGATADHGSAEAVGLKSDWVARFHWRLQRRVDYSGGNVMCLCCTMGNRWTGEIAWQAERAFDVSSGEEIPRFGD